MSLRNPYGFTFGADPEMIIVNDKDEPVPAVGIIPGTKTEPFAVNKGAIQVDGLAAEINITPADNFEEFRDNCATVIASLRGFLPKGWGLRYLPAVVFPPEVIASLPPEALELGCDPDFNAWTGSVNPTPRRKKKDEGLAVCAGHIHIGWQPEGAQPFDVDDPVHRQNCFDFVKQLDWYVGAWLSRREAEIGDGLSIRRRTMYGKAGSCRIKPYGVEYRVPSNFWLSKDKRFQQQLWMRMQAAIEQMSKRFIPDREEGRRYQQELIDYINSGAVADKKHILNRDKLENKMYVPLFELGR